MPKINVNIGRKDNPAEPIIDELLSDNNARLMRGKAELFENCVDWHEITLGIGNAEIQFPGQLIKINESSINQSYCAFTTGFSIKESEFSSELSISIIKPILKK